MEAAGSCRWTHTRILHGIGVQPGWLYRHLIRQCETDVSAQEFMLGIIKYLIYTKFNNNGS